MSPAKLEVESSVDINENDQKFSDESEFGFFRDQVDKVAEVGNESSSMHQMENGSGGDFGDFGSFDEAQKHIEPVSVIADTPLPTTNEDRDPMPAATLEAESSVDVDKEDQKILNDNVDGDFGDFQAQNDKLPEVDSEPPIQIDSSSIGDFGDFGAFGEAQKQEESVSIIADTPLPMTNEGAVPVSAFAGVVHESPMKIENSSGGDFGDFGSFDEAQKQTESVSVIADAPLPMTNEGAEPVSAFAGVVHESPMKIENSSGGDFGDFGSFDEAQKQAESVSVIADTPLPMTNEGAEPISAVGKSGSFGGEQQESAISSATNIELKSGDIVEAIEETSTVEDDHDKVDDFQHNTEMVNVGNKTVEDREGSDDDDDDDFGDFGSFDEAQQEEQILPESEETPSPAPSQIASTASLLGRFFKSPSSVVEVDIISSQKSLWNQPISMTSVLPEIDTNTPTEMRWSAKALKLLFPEIEEIKKIDTQTDTKNCEIKTNRRDTEMKKKTLNGVPGKLPDLSFMLSSTLSLPTRQKSAGDI